MLGSCLEVFAAPLFHSEASALIGLMRRWEGTRPRGRTLLPGDAHHRRLEDRLRLERLVARVLLRGGDLLDHFEAVDELPEGRVLAVEVRRGLVHDEELA